MLWDEYIERWSRGVSLFALLRAVSRLGFAAVGHDAASPHRRRQAVCRLRRRHGAGDRRLDANLVEILNRAGECGIARVVAGYIRDIAPITYKINTKARDCGNTTEPGMLISPGFTTERGSIHFTIS
jgi:hypothetical protein